MATTTAAPQSSPHAPFSMHEQQQLLQHHPPHESTLAAHLPPSPSPAYLSRMAAAAKIASKSPLFRQGRSSTDPQGRKCIDRYVLGRTLGQGSMGKVKLATNDRGDKFAVKIIPRVYTYSSSSTQHDGAKRPGQPPAPATPTPLSKEEEEAAETRVLREASALYLLDHPNIVRFYDAIVSPSNFYLFFEWIEGGQLLDYIVMHGKLREKVARRMAQSLVSAMEYCHEHFIVHRDLKIENILMTKDNDIKLIDFGLSNIYHKDSFLQTFCGSLYFASPELLSARPYRGPEVDCWSFGVILFVLTCGKVPFDSPSMAVLHAKIKRGEVVYPSHLSPDLHHLLSRILVVDPQKRATLAEIKMHPWIRGAGLTTGAGTLIDSHIPIRQPLTLPLDPYVIEYMRGFRFGTEELITRKLEEIVAQWALDREEKEHGHLDASMSPTKRFSAATVYSMTTEESIEGPVIQYDVGTSTQYTEPALAAGPHSSSQDGSGANAAKRNSRLSASLHGAGARVKRWSAQLHAGPHAMNGTHDQPYALSSLPHPFVALYYLVREKLERDGYVSPTHEMLVAAAAATAAKSADQAATPALALNNKNDSGTDMDEPILPNDAAPIAGLLSSPLPTVAEAAEVGAYTTRGASYDDIAPRTPSLLTARDDDTQTQASSTVGKESCVDVPVDVDLDLNMRTAPAKKRPPLPRSFSPTYDHDRTITQQSVAGASAAPTSVQEMHRSLSQRFGSPIAGETNADAAKSPVVSAAPVQRVTAPLSPATAPISPQMLGADLAARAARIRALTSTTAGQHPSMLRQPSMNRHREMTGISTMPPLRSSLSPISPVCESPATIHVRLDTGFANNAASFASHFDQDIHHATQAIDAARLSDVGSPLTPTSPLLGNNGTPADAFQLHPNPSEVQRKQLGQSHKNTSLFGRHWKQSSIVNFLRRSFASSQSLKSKARMQQEPHEGAALQAAAATVTQEPAVAADDTQDTLEVLSGNALTPTDSQDIGVTPVDISPPQHQPQATTMTATSLPRTPSTPSKPFAFLHRLPSLDKLHKSRDRDREQAAVPPGSPVVTTSPLRSGIVDNHSDSGTGAPKRRPGSFSARGLTSPAKSPPPPPRPFDSMPKTRYNPFAVALTTISRSYDAVLVEITRIIRVLGLEVVPQPQSTNMPTLPSAVTRVVFRPGAPAADLSALAAVLSNGQDPHSSATLSLFDPDTRRFSAPVTAANTPQSHSHHHAIHNYASTVPSPLANTYTPQPTAAADVVIMDIHVRKFPVMGFGVDFKRVEGDKAAYKALVQRFERAWAL
ncbi:Serine/threonine-protein kinase [Sorochytrium milnesiophthora]